MNGPMNGPMDQTVWGGYEWTTLPRGPWAFVLSLTRWEARKFTGGETFIVKPEVLDYWRSFDAGAVVERGSLVRLPFSSLLPTP